MSSGLHEEDFQPSLDIKEVDEGYYTIVRSGNDGRLWHQVDIEMHSGGQMNHSCASSERISDACVEGSTDEMLEIARAIKKRESVKFKRCAVMFDGDEAFFWSPRNSRKYGCTTYKKALELAKKIEQKIGAANV